MRPAARQDVHHLEVRKRHHERKHRHHHGDGLDERQGDVPELLELVGAVDVAGVVELRRHRLQAGQERNGEERQAAPGVHQDDREHRQAGASKPQRPLHVAPVFLQHQAEDADLQSPQPFQHPVEHAEGGVEHPQPRQTAEHGRDDERQQHGGAGKARQPKLAVQQNGEPHAEHRLDDRGGDGEDDGVPGRLVKNFAPQQLGKIGQPDEIARRAHHLVRQRHPHAQ